MNYKLIQIHHPSGRLYEAFRSFSHDCPDASFFQSDLFIRLLKHQPEAEFLLFVAVNEEALLDPGTRMHSGKGIGAANNYSHTAGQPPAGRAGAKQIMPESIAGSLLAVNTQHKPGGGTILKPVSKLLKKFNLVTKVYGTPLLAHNTRLQKEIVLKMLIKALHTKVHKRTNAVLFINSFDHQEYLPIYKGFGYKHREQEKMVFEVPHDKDAWLGRSESFRRRTKESLASDAEIIYDPDKSRFKEFFLLLNKQDTESSSLELPGSGYLSVLNAMEKTNDKDDRTVTKDVVVILISYHGRIIGWMVCVVLPKRLMHMVYAGVKRVDDQRVRPEIHALWAAMRYAAENNIPYIDLNVTGNIENVFSIQELQEEYNCRLITMGNYLKVNRLLGHLIAP